MHMGVIGCRLKQRVERASADAARQHAKADAMARAARKSVPSNPQLADIERLKVRQLRKCACGLPRALVCIHASELDDNIRMACICCSCSSSSYCSQHEGKIPERGGGW